MIALDSNILVRFFAGDDMTQSPRARRLILEELTVEQPGYVSVPVIVELIWVLARTYRLPPHEIRRAISALLEAPTLRVDQGDLIARALQCDHEDIADSLVHMLGKGAGCTKTVTFDKKFARVAGVELLAS
jgi:predicted nucleic-acid-binding protein